MFVEADFDIFPYNSFNKRRLAACMMYQSFLYGLDSLPCINEFPRSGIIHETFKKVYYMTN